MRGRQHGTTSKKDVINSGIVTDEQYVKNLFPTAEIRFNFSDHYSVLVYAGTICIDILCGYNATEEGAWTVAKNIIFTRMLKKLES